MRTVIEILGTECKVSQSQRAYSVTHVITDDGTEATFFGTDIAVGDLVEVFLHEKYGKIKVRKPVDK